jgi:hypothetical protein
MLAGAAGTDFARVLVDAEGSLMAPHFRAVDVARDNRLLPYQSSVSDFVFSVPGPCTELVARARLVYRAYPPTLARERAWASLDRLMVSQDVAVK